MSTLPPLVAQGPQVIWRIDAWGLPSVPLRQIVSAYQHDTAGARRFDHHFVARLEPGLTQRINGQRSLVFAADARLSAPAPVLYFVHYEERSVL